MCIRDRATIIPLVKCKSGDLTDTNNYRAIALSNAITKILESLLFSFMDSYDSADEYQFGFKTRSFAIAKTTARRSCIVHLVQCQHCFLRHIG